MIVCDRFLPFSLILVQGYTYDRKVLILILLEGIVLHGSSSVPQEEVETINKFGGALKAAIGIPEEWLRKAAKSSVCKINIDSDSRLAMTAAIRKTFAEKPAEFDPRKYLGPARDNMEKLYKHKIINVLGSNDKL